MWLEETANIAGQPNVRQRALQKDLKSWNCLSIMGQSSQLDVMQSILARTLWHWPSVGVLHHLAVGLPRIKSTHCRWPSLKRCEVSHEFDGLTFHGLENRDVQIEKAPNLPRFRTDSLQLWELRGLCERSLLSGVPEQESKYFQDQLKWSLTVLLQRCSAGSSVGCKQLFT